MAVPVQQPEIRTVLALSVGARVCLIVGGLFLVWAAYLFWGPIGHDVAGGFPARCGSAAQPPVDTLGKAVCGSINDIRRAESLAAAAAALVVVLGGMLGFGFTRVSTSHSRTTM
jgi:hypothetical protein